MEEQTSNLEGEKPTPDTEMSSNDSAQNQADQNEAKSAEEKPEGLKIIEEALGREFKSVEEAQESLKNLNSLVGEQTVAKNRKAIEKLAKESNLSPEEFIEVVEGGQNFINNQETTSTSKNVDADPTLVKVTRMDVNAFIKEKPEAIGLKDKLFAKALSSGKDVEQIWVEEYAPVYEAGKKLGAKKLQTTLEGQPLRAESADTENDTKVNFNGINPATGKRWTIKEMEQVLGYQAPSRRL